MAFEDGDPERPVILGSLWNRVQQAPRDGYYADTDMQDNNVKRIYTKTGNRIQVAKNVDTEAIPLQLPTKTPSPSQKSKCNRSPEIALSCTVTSCSTHRMAVSTSSGKPDGSALPV